MNMILSTVYEQAAIRPEATALQGADHSVSYNEMTAAITRIGRHLHQQNERVIGLLMDNCPAWAILDLATQYADCTLVPLPIFFSNQQLRHIIDDAGIETILTDRPQRLAALTNRQIQRLAIIEPDLSCHVISLSSTMNPSLADNQQADKISKITYTSGSSGHPKGVRLNLSSIETVTQSLASVIAVTSSDRHGCLLPLSTLLENIAGIYVPLLNGASSVLLPTTSLGTNPAARPDGQQLLKHLDHYQCTSTLLVPQLLQLLVAALQEGVQAPQTLRFAAVGGAPTSAQLIEHARQLGLPVYEGYGLSEATSVIAVNTAEHNKIGSVGRPLPHCTVKIADDGEILVSGALFDGYLHQSPSNVNNGLLATGDLGYLDPQGFLHINGRKKNMVITSNGRNISPEWIEKELIANPIIRTATVFGDQLPRLCAVIWPVQAGNPAQINDAIASVNRRLPAYAHIQHWLISTTLPSQNNKQLTATGGLDRNKIWQDFQSKLLEKYALHHLITSVAS